jgi:hypothetical protein
MLSLSWQHLPEVLKTEPLLPHFSKNSPIRSHSHHTLVLQRSLLPERDESAYSMTSRAFCEQGAPLRRLLLVGSVLGNVRKGRARHSGRIIVFVHPGTGLVLRRVENDGNARSRFSNSRPKSAIKAMRCLMKRTDTRLTGSVAFSYVQYGLL